MAIKLNKRKHPVPDSYRVYPFSDMSIGDSFDLPLEERSRVASAANKWRVRHGATFTVRKIDDEICRCWRVK